ncbi:MAG TPA: pyridoxal phosphate-dependent aminotransferase [Planctomycetota bacterium]|nr:pyridoxal phosphate-dependent aminotransferase [Planctomycetota bacterium]HRR80819.1 pyridoxal phosphate-dependent aminotransferase [Planctomycetota bacterium]HRT96431.1 pyridoxal phosphate-dependent aminotransferase [Planctomycetota bacterium]
MLSDRVRHIDASGIRKVFDLAATMKDPINLSIGQPDFDVPEPIKLAAIEAIRAGHNRYTQTQGIPELHAAIRKMLKERKQFEPEATLITSAVSGGLLLAFLATLNPGDEVIIPDPYFVMYKHLATLCGAKVVFLDTYPDFRLRREALEPLLTDRTKMIVVNSPCNPTGAVYTADELRMVADLARPRDILVVSDETYEAFVYDEPYTSMASIYPPTLLLSGFSKTYAMTGWRLGYAAGPGELISAMTKLQQYTFVCAPSFAQRAGLTALDYDVSDLMAAYHRRRDLIYGGLRDAGYEVQKPGGSFYIFPRVPWGSDMEFVEAAIRHNLLIIPGSVFSERKTHFRIAFPVADATIRRGIEVLQRLVKR